MKKLVIQSGHINIKYNSDPTLRTSTGAPGEQEFTLRIANRLSEILRTKGFEIQQTDANANSDPVITDKDWNLFLAIHYDANVYGTGGGFVDYPDPSIDAVNPESKRIKEAIESEYFQHSEIVNHPERSNLNTRFYYMWRALSARTPCIILECGVGQDAHDAVILADTERVCNAIVRGVCKAFSVSFDTPPPIPPTPPTITLDAFKQQIRNIRLSELLLGQNEENQGLGQIMEEDFKKIVRRLDALQKTIDLLYSDRNILEDILSRLSTLENALHLNREHQTEMQKDTRADVKEVKFAVEDKIDEVKEQMTEKTIIVKTKNQNVFQKILAKIR